MLPVFGTEYVFVPVFDEVQVLEDVVDAEDTEPSEVLVDREPELEEDG